MVGNMPRRFVARLQRKPDPPLRSGKFFWRITPFLVQLLTSDLATVDTEAYQVRWLGEEIGGQSQRRLESLAQVQIIATLFTVDGRS